MCSDCQLCVERYPPTDSYLSTLLHLDPGALACGNVTLSCIPNSAINWRLEAEELEAKHDYRQARERWLMGLPLLPSSSRPALHVAVLQHFEVRDAINHWRWAPIVNIRFGKTKVTLSYRHSH